MSERFYVQAGRIVDRIQKKQGTVRTLCLSEEFDASMKKRLVAVVTETLKCREQADLDAPVLEQVIEAAGLLKAERKLKKEVALVMSYDLLFGKGIHCKGLYRDAITRHKTRLSSELAKIKVKQKVKDNAELAIKTIQFEHKYGRINTLKISAGEFMERAAKEFPGCTVDVHISHAVAFPANCSFHSSALYKEGLLIPQDRASMLPAFILGPPEGAVCIDACAAPGNKTSHLAQMLNNTGKIFAFEINEKRFDTMKKLLSKAGCSNIEPICADFLRTDPTDPKFAAVEYMIVDPSCSGSGMIDRIGDEEVDRSRLEALAEFQRAAVLHGMKFPSLKRLTYSTCSIHEEENEMVVEKVLHDRPDFALVDSIPSWPRRGVPKYKDHLKMVRASVEDGSIGFFVACFERREIAMGNDW